MNLCIIGTLAYDSVETPFGRADDALGGSALFIATAASYFTNRLGIVGVVGGDFSEEAMSFLQSRGVDTSGIEVKPNGRTFRWAGKYHYDMNNRDTLDTQLNVLAEFDPVIPESMRDAELVCLGNIAPVLQSRVLDQMTSPKFIICDTMNFWIEGAPDDLKMVLARIDCLIINDSEARLLAGDPNIVKCARMIQAMGPDILIIKKGEHGALLFNGDAIFSAPALPLEEVFDPTGAGDTFAGGFIGYIAKQGEVTGDILRRAVIHGSAMASFCVEKFSVEALRNLTDEQINERVVAFKELSHFEAV